MDFKLVLMYRIRDLRRENKAKGHTLAGFLNITPSAISKWETGDVLPSIKALLGMAEFFSVSIDYLLGVSDIPNAETLLHEVRKNAGTHAYEGLTDPQRMAVETLVETFRQANDKKKTELSGTSEVGK